MDFLIHPRERMYLTLEIKMFTEGINSDGKIKLNFKKDVNYTWLPQNVG